MKSVKINGRSLKRHSSESRKENLSGILGAVQKAYRRRKKQLQWQLLIAKNPKKDSYPNYKGAPYEGPNVAIATLRHAKEVNDHYGMTPAPKLSYTPGSKSTPPPL
jgi:hypothetical protein